jgi:DNA replication protein DnaC
MERSDVLELMTRLKLFGMRAAYDEVMATALKRRDPPARIIGELLAAEIAEKKARSIKYQLTIAKLPLAKDLDAFTFATTPINESLVRDLATGAFLAEQRNAVLVGGTGTGKSHLAIAIARACIRAGARGRFHTVIDLVNRLENGARANRQGRLAEYLARMAKPATSPGASNTAPERAITCKTTPWFRYVTLRSEPMPRRPLGDRPLTNAERQARPRQLGRGL